MGDKPEDPLNLGTVLRFLGLELTDVREKRDLSRTEAVAEFATVTCDSIGDRTLLAYEHGIRDVSVRRLLQLCATYGASPVLVLRSAIHRANTDCCRECGR
jgi:hypothetical protein